jgi:hypothetical protein
MTYIELCFPGPHRSARAPVGPYHVALSPVIPAAVLYVEPPSAEPQAVTA